jgi:FlgD Ig-like domain
VSRRSLTLLAVALLLASAAAFAWTEKLKLERPALGATRFVHRFAPTCGCRRSVARLSFRLRRPERLEVAVVSKEDEHVVRTLAEGLQRPEGRVVLRWDGRDDAGRIVPDGAYRLRVHLEEAGRIVLLRRQVKVDTRPPRVRLLGVSDTVLTLGRTTISLRYEASELGKPLLLVDRQLALRGRPHRARRPGTISWDGTVRSRTVRPGMHDVALVLRDEAGNRSRPTEPVAVLVTVGK